MHVWNWLETLSSHLIRVREPAHRTTHQQIVVGTRGRHIFPNLDQPSSCSTRFHVTQVVLPCVLHEQPCKLVCCNFGGLAHRFHGPEEISKKETCWVHISVFWEEPVYVAFHLAMAKKMNLQNEGSFLNDVIFYISIQFGGILHFTIFEPCPLLTLPNSKVTIVGCS